MHLTPLCSVVNVTLSVLPSMKRGLRVWIRANTLRSPHMDAHGSSLSHACRRTLCVNHRFKSRPFPLALRIAAVIAVEVNISLKCHWKESADKNALSLSRNITCRTYERQRRRYWQVFSRSWRNVHHLWISFDVKRRWSVVKHLTADRLAGTWGGSTASVRCR